MIVAAVWICLGGVALVGFLSRDSSTSAPCPGADGRSRELRRCLSESLAYIETSGWAGSGVLLDDGYIVTNAHVVDPYDAVRVSFDGGDTIDDVPVVGVDAFTDIAVVGPIDTDGRPLSLDPIPDFDESDEPDVFLVGYPGAIEGGDPEIALAGGLLSRLREETAFDLTYLQTDAAIAGGQSGGALVDENGTLLGISGLSFADEFALALSADDVAASVERILAGDHDGRRVVPELDDAASEEASMDLTLADPSRIMILPADAARREIEVTATASEDVAITITTIWGEPIGVNGPGMTQARQAADEWGDPTLDDFEMLERAGSGSFHFEAPSDADIVVFVARVDDDTSVSLSANVPFEVFDDTSDGEQVAVGRPVRGVIDGFTSLVAHPLELQAGDEIEVSVRGGTSDTFFTLVSPGEELDTLALPEADDGGGGLYGLDAHDTFEIDESGTYHVVLGRWDGIVSGYELEVQRSD